MRRLILETVFALGASGLMLAAQTTPPPSAQGSMGGAQATSPDSQTTAKVRQGLMNDTNVGTAAHKIHVSTKNGMVTLKGKVASTEEKDAAVAKAKEIAGDANVKDDLTVSNTGK